MRSKTFILGILVLILLAQSCIPSLHPLYTKEKIVFLESLEGVWVGSDNDAVVQKSEVNNAKGDNKPAVWDFRKNEESGYLLIQEDQKGRKAAFDIFVVKLGNEYFMDFYPADFPKGESPYSDNNIDHRENELASYHFLPVHTFAKLIVNGETISIKMFDPEFLDNMFKHRQIRIKHERIDDGSYVLTAQPEELQKFVEKYSGHQEAFIDEVTILNKLK